MHFDNSVACSLRGKSRQSSAERLGAALLMLSGGKGRITRQCETNWASITFAGTRHTVEMVFEGEGAIEIGEDFIAELPEHEFAIRGQLVGDAEVIKVDHRTAPPLMKVTCEVLLLEEG